MHIWYILKMIAVWLFFFYDPIDKLLSLVRSQAFTLTICEHTHWRRWSIVSQLSLQRV